MRGFPTDPVATESITDWLKRIGSKKAMLKRQSERLALKLNAPVKGPHGLKNLVAKRVGVDPHPLKCKCSECIPDWLKEEMNTWPVVTSGMYEAVSKPVTVIQGTDKAPKKRKAKWTGNRGRSSN